MSDYYSRRTKLTADEYNTLYGLARLGWKQRSLGGYHLSYILKNMKGRKIPTRYLERSDLGRLLDPNITVAELEDIYETSTSMGKWMAIRHPSYPLTMGIEKYFEETKITIRDEIASNWSYDEEPVEEFFKSPFPICNPNSAICEQPSCCNVHKPCGFMSQHTPYCDKKRLKSKLEFGGIVSAIGLFLCLVGVGLAFVSGLPDIVPSLAYISIALIFMGFAWIQGPLIGPFTIFTVLAGLLLFPSVAWTITGLIIVDDVHFLNIMPFS